MQQVEPSPKLRRQNAPPGKLPVTVIIAVRNEAHNLPRCLRALGDVGQVIVVDSQSSDATVEIAREFGAQVVQFHYQGGWPKKRQWAMNTLPLAHDWILLLDADEVLTPELTAEIQRAIQNPAINGYYIALRIYFLGRVLRHGDARFWKLSLFRRGKGKYECRLKDQDASMADMEVHEHVDVDGQTARLRESVDPSQCRVALALHPEAQRIFQLGGAGLIRKEHRRQRDFRHLVRDTGPAATLARAVCRISP